MKGKGAPLAETLQGGREDALKLSGIYATAASLFKERRMKLMLSESMRTSLSGVLIACADGTVKGNEDQVEGETEDGDIHHADEQGALLLLRHQAPAENAVHDGDELRAEEKGERVRPRWNARP